MRWNMVLGALVVSVGLCSQSFGFELLDRMLGLNSYDCGHEAACCEPACDAEPACGYDTQPACGHETSCCDADPCDGHGHGHGHGNGHGNGHGLLDGLFSHGGHGSCGSSCDSCESACDTYEPSCGQETSCCESDPCGSKKHHGNLFSGLFNHRGHGHHGGCHSSGGCDSCGGGYGGSSAVDGPADSGDAAPIPDAPTPMADPSASLRSRRRVARTTSFASR
ncbi:MAG: hypothetical protein ACC645_02870 [Pirellulales bacterium]